MAKVSQGGASILAKSHKQHKVYIQLQHQRKINSIKKKNHPSSSLN